MRQMSYVNLTRFVQTLLDRKDRMSMAVGLEVRVPFCDHRLVEYAFNIPWAMKAFDGRERAFCVLRHATCCPHQSAIALRAPIPQLKTLLMNWRFVKRSPLFTRTATHR